MTLKFDGWHWKTKGHIFYTYTTSSFAHHFKSIGEVKLDLRSGNAHFGSKLVIFVLRDLEMIWMTLKNNRAPLIYCNKLCVSFQSHGWIQTGVTVRKLSIQVKIYTLLSHVTLKLTDDIEKHGRIEIGVTVRRRSIWVKSGTFLSYVKFNGHLSYADSSFVHNFIAIAESKLELHSGNAQLGSKSKIF